MLELARVVSAVIACGALAVGGIDGDDLYPLPNADFDSGLSGWAQWASDGSSPFRASPPPDGPGRAARCDLPPGVEGRLELLAPIGAGMGVDETPAPGRPGEKVGYGAWVWLSPTARGGEVWLTLESVDGASSTILSESIRLDPSAAPAERWIFLSVLPNPLTDGRVQTETQALRYALHSSATGTVWFDAVRAGRFEYSEYPLENGSFEEGLPAEGAWQTTGLVTANDPVDDPGGYYGVGHARLEGWSGTSVWQTIDLPGGPDAAPPSTFPGSEVEAGVWLRAADDAYLPITPSPSVYVEVAVWGLASGSGDEALLARGRYHPILDERGYWQFLQTESLEEILPVQDSLRVEVSKSFDSDVWIDFVQVGERFSVDGNPRRRVGCNYVGRYRSPLFPGCSTNPSASQDIWRNWHWTIPNACNPGYDGFFHDPDCTVNPDCVRPNGRRDVAISTLRSEHDLPLAGAYDSRDGDLIRYHLDLAEAVGIDHFVYEYLGQKLAIQTVIDGREALNAETLEVLLNVAEEPGRDLKLAVMYEPKVHYLGWVRGEHSEQAKLSGMIYDLVWLVEDLRERRCALRHDGRLVVFVFRNTICSPDGTQCLDDADWLAVTSAVEVATGESLFLIADLEPGSGSPFRGLSRWQLVRRELLEYRTYADAEVGSPTWPAPRLGALSAHASTIHGLSCDWAAEEDSDRVSIGVVWPDFDDTGVGGWGTGNLVGEDGLPLCVRVADDFDGAFYATTVGSALELHHDWIQIATWNDWNENTRIEPAWHPDFFTRPFGASSYSGKVYHQVFGRLAETATWIGAFKGEDPKGSFERIAWDYLWRAYSQPGVTAYD